jgi:hypothetical protein
VSLTSCALIVFGLHAMLDLLGSPTSRLQALVAVVLALALGVVVHGSLLVLCRRQIGPLLPAAGERMLAMPAAWLRARAR